MEAEPLEPIPTPEQQAVLDAVADGEHTLITGEAGTGKSFLLERLNEQLHGRLPVVASTGIAAVNVGGCTIHSWIGCGLAKEPAIDLYRKLTKSKWGEKFADRIANAKYLAIDELSMVDGDFFDKLDWLFRYCRYNEEVPFGGCQILGFGDFLQLPPVSRHGLAKFAFESEAWQQMNIKVCHLTQVFRQRDRWFSEVLSHARVQERTEELEAMFNLCRMHTPEKPLILHTHNADVDAYNLKCLEELEGKLCVNDAKEDGEEKALAQLDRYCLAPKRLMVKIGCRVMLLKNIDSYGGLCNGSMGTLVAFKEGHPVVEFDYTGTKVTLDWDEWEITEKNPDGTEKVKARRKQFPLRLAYALTIHKAQGMSLDRVQVSLAKCFAGGQAYVALSRARSLEGLRIETGDTSNIRADVRALQFYEQASQLQLTV